MNRMHYAYTFVTANCIPDEATIPNLMQICAWVVSEKTLRLLTGFDRKMCRKCISISFVIACTQESGAYIPILAMA